MQTIIKFSCRRFRKRERERQKEEKEKQEETTIEKKAHKQSFTIFKATKLECNLFLNIDIILYCI
jgi:ribosomal protein L9